MKHLNKYIEALNKGSEVVIVNDNPDFFSAIFWKDREGSYSSFSKAIGESKRPDFNDDRFLEHIAELETEGVRIFIRGFEEW